MRDLYFPCIPRSTRSFVAIEGMAPRGDHLPLTCFSRKNHLGNTPFGHYLLPPLSATLLRELSRGTPSSKECPSEGGVMTVYRIRLKERLNYRWSARVGALTEFPDGNGGTVLTRDGRRRAPVTGPRT